jgi:hypothetical protein
VPYTFQTLTTENKDTASHGIGRFHRWTGALRPGGAGLPLTNGRPSPLNVWQLSQDDYSDCDSSAMVSITIVTDAWLPGRACHYAPIPLNVLNDTYDHSCY